ncbi:Cytosine/adenosine deaminase [Gordonia terrae C-6]|uniref:Cytosine/adenosine deaminase n=1 Tax=Gordonia terrae C-6 TaxID=1316928 RepID=R7Y6U7_9ACTN|nr:nucleoside deaminase [Gordonia terrae]EON31758.1 Cytosine/adenosine deaminase [Gordonia terrae C-6]
MTISDRERELLRRAIELAGEAGERGNRPFGSVIVVDDVAVAEGRNEVSSSGDISAHAELVALRRAIADGHGERLAGATVYASGEPCPMCAAACVWAGVGRIVFAASTAAFTSVIPDGPHFRLSCAEMIASSDAAIVVDGPRLEEEALPVMSRYAG